MYTQNSISSLVAQFLRLQKNALEIINGLNEVATSTNETVSIEVLDDNGNPTTASIPSYGYMRAQIERIDNNIKVWITSDTHYHHKNICRGVTNWRTQDGKIPMDQTRDFQAKEG